MHEQRTATVRVLGRGNRDWVATKLCLNNRARSRRQENSSGDSSWAATATACRASHDELPGLGEQLR